MPATPSPGASTGRCGACPNCGKGQPEQVMGTGHGASPSRFRKIKVGQRVCGVSCHAHLRAGRSDAARAHGASPRSKPSSPARTQALTRFANNAIHQNVAERDDAPFGAPGDRRPHRARHHQPARPRRPSATVVAEAIAITRLHGARPATCRRWPSRDRPEPIATAISTATAAAHAGRARPCRGGGYRAWSSRQARRRRASTPRARRVVGASAIRAASRR